MKLYIIAFGCIIIAWLYNRWRQREFVSLAKKLPSKNIHTWLGWGPVLGSKVYGGFTSTIGSGVISNNEPEWNHHRKVVNPAFSNKNIVSFIPIFNMEVNNMIQQLKEKIEKGHSKMDMLTIFRELTISNASQTTLKRKFHLTDMKLKNLTNSLTLGMQYISEACINRTMDIKIFRKLSEMTVYKQAVDELKIFNKYVCECLQVAAAKNTNDPSYVSDINGAIDYLVEGMAQKKLSVAETENEAKNIFAGAFETTSTTLFSVVILLAMYPEYQEKVYEEVSAVLLNKENDNVLVEDLDKMVYLEMFLNESMRVLPVVPQVSREVTDDNVTLRCGITLPIGQTIIINIHHMQRDKNIWGPDADRFNPDNFLPSNVDLRHPFAFIPFTKGLRSCIGNKFAIMFLKVTVAKLVKAFKFITDFKYENLEIQNHLTLKFAEEPEIYVARR